MIRVAIVVGLFWGFMQTAFADVEQDQHQRQAQDQAQEQAQAAVAVQGQAQSTTQGNDQVLHQDVQGQGRNLVQSSPVLVVGAAEEGLSLGTPWGNASLGKLAEVTKVVSCWSFVAINSQHDDPRVQGLVDQCVKAAKRCGLLCHVGRWLF